MSKQEMNDVQLLQKTPEELSIKEYKAAFYQLLAKPDSMTKVYNKTAIVGIEDVFGLNERICEKFAHYNEAGFLIQVNVKFSNGKRKTFSNWDSFAKHQWYENESITNMVITWEFNAIFPNMKNAERHTLMVKLSNGLRPEEMLNLVFTGKIEEIEELDNNLFPIVARVDFVDRILGDELLNIVGEWVKSLNESPVHKSQIILRLKRNKGKLCSIINWVTNIVIMFCSVGIMGKYVLSLKFQSVAQITNVELIHIIYAVFICAAVWIFGKRFSGAISDFLFEKLKMYGENALFNITNGDFKKQEKIRRQERSNKIAIIANLIFTIIINIACGLIVNKISL